MRFKNFLVSVPLLIILLFTAIITHAASNEAVTAANSVIGEIPTDRIGSQQVIELPSGNLVISSPNWNFKRGAVTCLTPAEYQAGGIIVNASNSLVGSTVGDQVGQYGITVLTNGNYVVATPLWNDGAVTRVGAVTWVNGTTCIPHGESGRGVAVSATNSLVGSTASDQVGDSVTALTNGNYVVSSRNWNNLLGAATWGSGTTGISGAVSAANSLVGSTAQDQVGLATVALSNGNYVVQSSFWDNASFVDAGAVTWGNGAVGITGTISDTNSLVGGWANNRIGSIGVTALTNGNYVVASPNWTDGASAKKGAVTWADGTTAATGIVDSANSIVGTGTNHSVGNGGVVALTNGNYVIVSYNWDNGGTLNVGAVTWVSGAAATNGFVDITNSLVGSSTTDQIGSDGVKALPNGNYVVSSHLWNNGSIVDAGAVTWGNGMGGTVGAVSASNSLVGSTANDKVGGYPLSDPITVLTNGNYVVVSPEWDNGMTPDVGAVTWASGTSSTTGAVSPGNSLIGGTVGDSVGNEGITALSNGNYVVISTLWNDVSLPDAGAVTWSSGTTPLIGTVTSSNSLVGGTVLDVVGSGGVTALTNGNYVVASPDWDNGSFVDAGAATWGSGTTGIAGLVSSTNSLISSQEFAKIGSDGVTALTNGDYVVASPLWNNDAVLSLDSGAATWGDGTVGLVATVGVANSLVGINDGDAVGGGTSRFPEDDMPIVPLANGNYIVRSSVWDNIDGYTSDAGAVTYGTGGGITPVPEPTLSIELSDATGSGAEGTSGTNAITSITLLVSGGISTSPHSVQLVLNDGTAKLVNNDYDQSNDTITIPAGDYTAVTSLNIPVAALGIVGDTALENNETLTLKLQNPSSNLIIGDANGSSTIINSAVYTITTDDTPSATVTIGDVSLTEGNSGTSTMTFTATLNGSVPGGFNVTAYIADGTATAGDSDYVFTPPTMIFSGTNGDTRTIEVTINGDTKVEANETFTISMANVSNALIDISDTAIGTIINDDVAIGSVSIADVTKVEGNSGTSTMTFSAVLSGPVPGGFTVNTAVTSGTATTPSDYVFTSGILNFAGTNGEIQTFTVTINGDPDLEANETFTVSLNASSNPSINILDTAIGTITNDDVATVTIADVSMPEGSTGSSPMTFTALLTGSVPGGFTVNTAASNVTATSADGDYVFTPGILTFAGTSGETHTFTATINGDNKVEANETFMVSLNTVSNVLVTITDTAIGTITDDDKVFFTWVALPAIGNATLDYELQIATANTFAAGTIVATATTSLTSLSNIGPIPLADGVKYWRVRGKYTVTASGAVFYSAYSTVRSFTVDTVPPPASLLSAPANAAILTTGTPAFSWATSAGASTYRLEIDTNGNFSSVELSFGSLAALNLVLPPANALSSGTYAWRVVAIDKAGNETVSGVRTFTIGLP